MATKNLFSKAKATAPKSSAKKDEKVRINLNDPDFFDKISMLETLQDRMKSDKAQADMLSDEIKQLKKEIYSAPFYHQSITQTDRTHHLLEELKVIKERELNMMLREKIPVPFSFPTILSNLKLNKVSANANANATKSGL
jgi:hypothetical protein